MSTTQPRAAPAALLPAGWATLMITHDGQHAEEVAYGPQIMMDRLRKWLDRYFAMLTTPATVAGQCEDAIELLGKYKDLCEEIKRGYSYHLGRIDSAISALAQAAPQPAVQAWAPVAWRSWDSENSRWNFTLWPDEWAGHADVWEPLYTYPAAPAAQGDARAEQALLKVLTAVQRYLPPDGPSAKDTLAEIIGIIDPWPLGDQKGQA